MKLISLARRLHSESKPTLTMPRKRLPLASPTSIRRLSPASRTATAASGSSGMPSTRARSLPRPPGMMPSGVSEPAIAPPTAPTRPSPLITTGTSPASTARRACSTPCSRPLRALRPGRRPGARRAPARPAAAASASARRAEAGLTSSASGIPSISIARSLVGSRDGLAAAQADDREAAVAGAARLERLEAARGEARGRRTGDAAEAAGGRGADEDQARRRAAGPGRSRAAAGRPVDCDDQVEVVVGEGEASAARPA